MVKKFHYDGHAILISRVFVAMDGDNKPHGWVYVSLEIGIAWPIYIDAE